MLKLIVTTGIIFIFGIASFVFYNNNKNTAEITTTTIHSDCSLQKMPCKVFMPDGQMLLFVIEPNSLPAMEPLRLSVTGGAILKNPFKVWFEGKNMNMGRHYMLLDHNKNQAFDKKIFKGMIPVCSIDNEMVWLLNVEVALKNQLFKIQF